MNRSVVVVLDEFDKAHSAVQAAYVNLIRSGRVLNRRTGTTVDCRGRVIVFVTANLDQDEEHNLATDLEINQDLNPTTVR